MDRIDGDDTRTSSLELGALGELFEADRFPITTEALIESHGDAEVGYPDGSESLQRILETSGRETYESPDELELAILTGVGGDAVGRQAYSDRGDELAGDGSRSEQSL